MQEAGADTIVIVAAVPFSSSWLFFAPGGLDEMSLRDAVGLPARDGAVVLVLVLVLVLLLHSPSLVSSPLPLKPAEAPSPSPSPPPVARGRPRRGLANSSACSGSKASQSMAVTGSRWCVPWYSWVPWGTEARERDMPLWLSEEPHWRSGEWIALKMWLALRRAEVCSGERAGWACAS